MGKSNNNNKSVLLIAVVVFAAMASMANCQAIITRARVIGPVNGLTCSNPSPSQNKPALSGANVTVSCLGGTNTTQTDATGKFELYVTFPFPVTPGAVITSCGAAVTLPPNCNLYFWWWRITTLRSFLTWIPVSTGTTGLFRANYFAPL